MDNATINGDGDGVISKSLANGGTEKIANPPKDTTPATKIITESTAEPIEKPVDKESGSPGETIVAAVPKENPTESTADSAVKPSSPPQTNFTPINGAATKVAAPAKKSTKKSPQVAVTPPKKPSVKPTLAITATSTAQKKPAATTTPVTPTKRAPEPTIIATPEAKRTKVVPTPTTPTPLTIVSRIPSGSASPRPLSIERKVADRRKKLEALRQKRLETAKKQDELEKKLGPYKQRMAEELERLNC